VNHWAEVKPVKLTKTEELKVEDLVVGTENPCLLLVGQPKCCPVAVIEDLEMFFGKDCLFSFENGCRILLDGSRLSFNDAKYETGNLFGSGKTWIRDVVVSNEKLDENRFYHSTGLDFTDNLDGFFIGVEEAVSAALSAKF
jgi:hypothetical protein